MLPFAISFLRSSSLFALLVLLGACSSVLQTDKVNYKSENDAKDAAPLEVPPDLTKISRSKRYELPSGSISAKTLNDDATVTEPETTSPLRIADLQIKKSGGQIWLEVDRSAEVLWPQIKSFWTEAGFTLAREEQKLGLMETDWAENRAKLPQDFIRRSIGKVLDSLYSTGERDKFRISLERTPDNKTEIYISHRGLIEVYSDSLARKTVWQPRPSDPELEKEFLRRLMIQLDPTLASNDKAAEVNAPSKTSASSLISIDGAAAVSFNQGFDITWRRVGVTLDRNGFTVEDRDRKIGVYFVRYIEVNADGEPGFFSRIFSKATPVKEPLQFRIKIESTQEQQSTILILNSSGTPDGSETAKKIAQLLVNELQ
ncbi:MAG: outer membrane protein assembly factor BamC [Limnohabitans sp.]